MMTTTVTPSAYELYMACQDRDIARVKELLKQGADPNGDFHGVAGDKLLHHYEVQSAGEKILDLLIGAGAELEARDANGYTPLMRAVHELNSSALRYFIEKGASLELKDNFGNTPLGMARYRPEQKDIIKDAPRLRAAAEEKRKAAEEKKNAAKAKKRIDAFHVTATKRQERLKNLRPKMTVGRV